MKKLQRRKDGGITLRDQFAMNALQGLLACPEDGRDAQTGRVFSGAKDRVKMAYRYADLMMKQRAK